MESLAPPLALAIELQATLSNGESIRSALVRYATESHSEFSQTVRKFLVSWEQSQDWRSVVKQQKSAYRRSILELAANALAGQSIQTALGELQKEIEVACDEEIKLHIDMLPLKMLCPLLFLQFPAFLMVLFGPLLSRFIEEMSK